MNPEPGTLNPEPLEHFRPPQIVHMHDSGDPLGSVLDHDNRCDFPLFHDVQRFDSEGRPSFGALQPRMHVGSRAQAIRSSVLVGGGISSGITP